MVVRWHLCKVQNNEAKYQYKDLHYSIVMMGIPTSGKIVFILKGDPVC